MRVLINAVSAKMGGAANYINALAKGLENVEQHEFIFLVPEQQAERMRETPTRIRVIGTNIAYESFLRRLWFDQVRLRRILLREHVDVLFSTANFGTLFCPCRQLLLVRNSLYFSSIYRTEVSRHKNWKIRASERLRRWLVCRSAAAADLVMTPSRSMLYELQGSACPRASVVNPYGVDRTRFHPVTKPFGNSGTVLLLFTSLYAEHKNFGTLFGAVLQLEKCGMKCKLISTADPSLEPGRNPIRDSDCKLVMELRHRGLFEFTGVPAPGVIEGLYGVADIFVYPSPVESFGHPLLEAMSAGLPVVAADVPVNRELCSDAAIYFCAFNKIDCANQIKRVIDDVNLRNTLVQRGAERANDFEWSSHVENLVRALPMSSQERL